MVGKRVFVTVGTTKFEKLIDVTSSKKILDILQHLGYTVVQYQTGTGRYKEQLHSVIKLCYDSFFVNFDEEIHKSDLIISHAGAGTCLQVLKKHKPLIVVINDDLMDNHQVELAEQLEKDGFLYYCTCNTLKDVLSKNLANLKSYPKPDESLFVNYLDKCMGFID